MYDALFADFSLSAGKLLSKAERKRTGLLDDKALIYGEVRHGKARHRSAVVSYRTVQQYRVDQGGNLVARLIVVRGAYE